MFIRVHLIKKDNISKPVLFFCLHLTSPAQNTKLYFSHTQEIPGFALASTFCTLFYVIVDSLVEVCLMTMYIAILPFQAFTGFPV